jgi:hypothetical protein
MDGNLLGSNPGFSWKYYVKSHIYRSKKGLLGNVIKTWTKYLQNIIYTNTGILKYYVDRFIVTRVKEWLVDCTWKKIHLIKSSDNNS